MTKEELLQLQHLDLETKILKTKQRIREFYDYYGGQVYVSFSGGKDSTVLLHIVRQEYPDVRAVYIDTGLEYPEIKDFVRSIENVEIIRPKKSFLQVIQEYGYPIISKEIALNIEYARKGSKWALNRLNGEQAKGKYKRNNMKYKYLLNAPFKISSKCCDVIKKSPAKIYEHKTGLHPIVGTMASEGGQRESAYLRTGCNSFEGRGVSKPLSFWTEEDVWNYIKKYNVKYSKIYDMGYERTGCMFCMFGLQCEKSPNRFEKMEKTHPQIYDYCMNKLNLKEVINFIENKGG